MYVNFSRREMGLLLTTIGGGGQTILGGRGIRRGFPVGTGHPGPFPATTKCSGLLTVDTTSEFLNFTTTNRDTIGGVKEGPGLEGGIILGEVKEVMKEFCGGGTLTEEEGTMGLKDT